MSLFVDYIYVPNIIKFMYAIEAFSKCLHRNVTVILKNKEFKFRSHFVCIFLFLIKCWECWEDKMVNDYLSDSSLHFLANMLNQKNDWTDTETIGKLANLREIKTRILKRKCYHKIIIKSYS